MNTVISLIRQADREYGLRRWARLIDAAVIARQNLQAERSPHNCAVLIYVLRKAGERAAAQKAANLLLALVDSSQLPSHERVYYGRLAFLHMYGMETDAARPNLAVMWLRKAREFTAEQPW